MANDKTEYRDESHITEASRIDQSKVPSAIKKLSTWIRQKMYGEETMPVFMLQVAEDNPDFGLKKGDTFGIQIPLYGVLGLKKALEDNKVIYQPATPTSDGLMSASDKDKLDGLQQYTEATEEQAGLMPASDKAKLNKLEEGPVNNVQIKDTVTGSIYLLTVSNGEIKLLEGADNSDGSER